AQEARDRRPLAGVARELVAALAGDQGDRVAQPAHLPPGPLERVGVRVVDEPALAGSLERGQGARAPQGRHLAGVPELEELNRPLDVGQPTAPELEMGVWVGASREALSFQ